MIKRFLTIILILTSSVIYSQQIPESFKLGKTYTNTSDLKTSFKPSSVLANPKNSKCPISNSFTDIFKSGDTVWFATGSGIMRTSDKFNSFDSYYGVEPFGTDEVPGFMIKNNIFVVSTFVVQEISSDFVNTGTGIKVSTDYGRNWNSFPQPMDGRYDTVVVYGSNNIHALPVVVPQQNLSYSIAITKTKNDLNNSTIWITSFAGGLRKSTDYGNTWQRVLLPPDDLDSIYTGGTYNFVLNPNINYNHRAFSVFSQNDSTIYVGTANGINVSKDWGISWKKYTFQNSGSGTNRVGGNFVVNFNLQKFNNKEIIWAATRRANDNNEVNSLSYTTNNGLNWAYTLGGYAPNGIFSKDSIVYGLTDGGLWRARFGVFDWSKPSLIADPTTKDICKSNSFYTGNSFGDTLYIAGPDGLLRTKETGIPWASQWKIYRACGSINEDSKTFAAPNPFAPNLEVTRIFYKTNKNSAKITIKIFDFGMNPVRTVIQNAVRSSNEGLFTMWDGKNDDGYVAANGVYFYRIEIDDDSPQWGKIILLQ